MAIEPGRCERGTLWGLFDIDLPDRVDIRQDLVKAVDLYRDAGVERCQNQSGSKPTVPSPRRKSEVVLA